MLNNPNTKFIFIIFSFLLLTGCSTNTGNKNNGNAPDSNGTNSKKVYKRFDLETNLYGKPEKYVRELLGEPDKVQELIAINTTWWHYKSLTYKDNPNILDTWTLIRFDAWTNGKVNDIQYK
jgi:hypothetical protein